MKLSMPAIIGNMKVGSKITLMLLAPVLGLLYFSVSSIREKSTTAREIRQLQELARLAVTSSELVHETQKERGRTAGFLGSTDARAVELLVQRSTTDEKVAELETFLRQFDATPFGSTFERTLRQAVNDLADLDEKRDDVSARRITCNDAIAYYTRMNAAFLDLVSYMSRLSTNAELSMQIAAYVNFMQAKERAGIERAVLNATFATASFAPGDFTRFISLVAEQSAYTNVFLSLATDEQQRSHGSTVRGRAVDEVERLRLVATEKAVEGNFGVDAAHWFDAATDKINLMKDVEDGLAADLSERARQLLTAANRVVMSYIIASLVVLVVSIVLAGVIAMGIARSLRETVRVLEGVAEGVSSSLNAANDLACMARDLQILAGRFKYESNGNSRTRSGSECAVATVN